MGCGSGRKSQPPKIEAQNGAPASGSAPPSNVLKVVMDNSKGGKNGEGTSLTKEAPTIQGSFVETMEENSNKCLRCTSTDTSKTHALDCTHNLCLDCARNQVEQQMKTKQGNIIYFCKTCNAPKNLSMNSILIE